MADDDLKQLAANLKKQQEQPYRHLEELDHCSDATSKVAKTTPDPTATNPPSSYVATIKTYFPITLDLEDSNNAKWRELFSLHLVATSHQACHQHGRLRAL
jgi:hypothetical protein